MQPRTEAFRQFRPTVPLGTYQSGFPYELSFEQWLFHIDQLVYADQRLAGGEHVSGPAPPPPSSASAQARPATRAWSCAPRGKPATC